MTDISADTLMPGGEFKATLCTGILTVASGSSGALLTANSSGGRKIRLTNLFLASGSEAGITVSCDGQAVISGLTLSPARNVAGNFLIGADVNGANAVINMVEAFNTITVTKASGSTAGTIYYSLEQGN